MSRMRIVDVAVPNHGTCNLTYPRLTAKFRVEFLLNVTVGGTGANADTLHSVAARA